MTEQSWPTEFDAILRAYLALLHTEESITADLRLVDYGLDSLATVSLLLELEEAFKVSVPDHLLTPETFATPAGLWSAVASLQAPR